SLTKYLKCSVGCKSLKDQMEGRGMTLAVLISSHGRTYKAMSRTLMGYLCSPSSASGKERKHRAHLTALKGELEIVSTTASATCGRSATARRALVPWHRS